MTRKEIEERCHKLSASESKCSFTSGDIWGFIDTSPRRDGSRGIAFYENSMTIKIGSSSDVIAYDNIRSVVICESYENSFADELIISADENEIRISDYSLDKSELKALIDKLCKKDNIPQNIPAFEKLFSIEKDDDNETRIIPTRQADNSEIAFDSNISKEDNKVIESELQNAVSENEEDISEFAEVDEDKISDALENEDISEIAKIDEKFFSAVKVENKDVVSENDEKDFDEQEELERISSMSHEQTVSYLANAFDELNTPSSPQNVRNDKKISSSEIDLSEEPVRDDIYIKASRKLRELCEEEKLSMEMIEEELRKDLIPAAEVFAKIIENNSEIPNGLSEKINELKNAANDLDKYFSYGEDIGIRTMFFMLFQMLSYSDRIIEDPKTKEKLNDFFRKFGSAGIILSMLDMRI